MTREEAGDLSARRNREHAERARYRWFPRRGANGEWSVAKAAIPGHGGSVTPEQPGKTGPPPDLHPLDLPGGVPPWSAGG